MSTLESEETLDKRSRRSRQWLKDALKDLLAEQAFDDISITDISEKADVSRFTFYKHFDSKEALLLSMVEDVLDNLFSHMDMERVSSFLEGDESTTFHDLITDSIFSYNKDSEEILKLGLDRFSQTVLRTLETRQMDAFQKIALMQTLSQKTKASLHILNIFLAGGVLALLAHWLQEELSYEGETMDEVLGVFARILLTEGLLSGKVDEVLEATH